MREATVGKTSTFGLTNNQLKIIAMLSMCLDHIGVQLFPGALWLRMAGRLAFPIFAYMIAEGCRYTKNRTRYLLQLAILGVGCQTVFFIAARDWYQGILLTFSLSVSVIFAIDAFLKKKNVTRCALMVGVVLSAIFLSVVAPVLFKEIGFRMDYDFLGVFLPVGVYYAGDKRKKLMVLAIAMAIMSATSKPIQWISMLSVLLLMLYNGTRGKAKMKYVFYIFYPAHLAIIFLIGLLFGLG